MRTNLKYSCVSHTRCEGLSLAMFFFSISGSKRHQRVHLRHINAETDLLCCLVPVRFDICGEYPLQESGKAIRAREYQLAHWSVHVGASPCVPVLTV
jgi:hypothetical protein